jgi:glutamate:GABA antiporter
VLKLRYSYPHVRRPFLHPWGMAGIWVSTALVTGWIVLGSWVAVFPGVLEHVFGIPYAFHATWGVHRGLFEALTLGTLGVIVAVGLIGYWFGREVRSQNATIPIGDVIPPSPLEA